MSRLTTSWKPAGTVFFRLASSALFRHLPFNEGYGTNLQNPDESLMRSVVPDEGKIFISADQEGAEARIVAMEAPRGNFRALFDAGIKPHQYMAVDLFVPQFRAEFFPSKPTAYFESLLPAAVKTLPEWPAIVKTLKSTHAMRYFIGKKTIHAADYGMSWATFQSSALKESAGTLVLSEDESKFFLARHKHRFPEIYEWQKTTLARAINDRVLYNLLGHPITITRELHPHTHRELYAAVPQSTVAEITNLAFTELQTTIADRRLPYDLLNNKHDSILAQVPNTKEHVEQYVALVKKHLGRTITSSFNESFIMGVEVSAGFNWGKHSAENPHGLREIKL